MGKRMPHINVNNYATGDPNTFSCDFEVEFNFPNGSRIDIQFSRANPNEIRIHGHGDRVDTQNILIVEPSASNALYLSLKPEPAKET